MSERYLANENFPAEIVRHSRRRADDVFYATEEMAGAADIEVLRIGVRFELHLFPRNSFGRRISAKLVQM